MKIGDIDILWGWAVAAIICVVIEIGQYTWLKVRGEKIHRGAFLTELVLNIVFAPAYLLAWIAAIILVWINKMMRI